MAASDKNYRDQYGLDVVFSISSLLMLVSLVWMFAQDYYREFKTEQRAFRDVESALAATLALEEVPGAEFLDARGKVLLAKAARRQNASKIESERAEINKILPEKELADGKYNAIKAEIDSLVSLRDIAVDHNAGSVDNAEVKRFEKRIADYESQLVAAKAAKDEIYARIRSYQSRIDSLEDDLTKKIGELKKVTDKFDAQVALAIGKEWGWGDAIRAAPILDAFASPIRIHQHVIKDVTIDYNFVQAVRFDRCMTCHQGIDRSAFTRANLDHIVSHFDPIQEQAVDELLDYIRGMSEIPVRKDAEYDGPEELYTFMESMLKSEDPNERKEGKAIQQELSLDYLNEFRRYAIRLKGARVVFDALARLDAENAPIAAENASIADKEKKRPLKQISNEELAALTSGAGIPLATGPRGQIEQLRVRYYDLVALLAPKADPDARATAGRRVAKIVELEFRLAEAQFVLDVRRRALKDTSEGKNLPKPGDLKITRLAKDVLTNARITEFCAHPRQDLYVSATSKHPVEKFGCTSCHAGQPSSTSFVFASHTPKDTPTKDEWVKKFGWYNIHDWDFPMTPKRFVESGCLKCHHQVTDLITTDNRVEAPKLLRGYNLIRENGCFGCHEIAGRKGGRDIGPDLRLEANPPLEDLSPGEVRKIESDPETRPGNLRKVGPSLFRLSEKTTELWTSQWIRSPRGFRPDTKMPHFYGLSNNSVDVLPENQKAFPKAEIQAISYYLFHESRRHVKEVDKLAALAQKKNLGEEDRKTLAKLEKEIRPSMRQPLKSLDELIGEKDFKADPKRGRTLFMERGCLACHDHRATEAKQFKAPTIKGEADFGPNLSQVALKFSDMDGKKSRAWLTQWILDPHVHSPRSRMPVTHLNPGQAADIAEWILTSLPEVFFLDLEAMKSGDEAQAKLVEATLSELATLKNGSYDNSKAFIDAFHKATSGLVDEQKSLARSVLRQTLDLGAEWFDDEMQDLVKASESDTFKSLARVYFIRIMAEANVKKLLDGNMPADDSSIKSLPQDEKWLAENFTGDNLRLYVGKKAVSRLGCYACHDVPGFDNAKPIGVGLNDWGNKKPERLAFEDIHNYIQKKHFKVELPIDPATKKPVGTKDGKTPIEAFYWNALEPHHGTRIGYLFQKLNEPRSYDYNRVRSWDDRARMPQFRFARLKRNPGESDKDFDARQIYMEQEAREAVMTFILGLTAEQVPTQSINQPKGDRLAEVKGRQVLDNFNCAGCHQIRPGYIEYRLRPSTLENEKTTPDRPRPPGNLALPDPDKSDHFFPNHENWRDPRVAENKLIARGYFLRDLLRDADPELAEDPETKVKLVHAARFQYLDPNKPLPIGKATNEEANIPAAMAFTLKPEDIITPEVARLPSDDPRFQEFLRKQGGLYGGLFSDLLTLYLYKLDKEAYKMAGGDSSRARLEGPPPLMGQGERTQPEWLYQFLLDPHPVRKMSRLRMPRFNMSKDDAKALVAYFGAVERMTNTNLATTFPFEAFEQKGAEASSYWQAKNVEYVSRMKSVKSKADPKKSVFDLRLQELEPLWKRIAKDLDQEKKNAEEQRDLAVKIYEKQKAEVEKLKAAGGKELDLAQAQLDRDTFVKDAAEKKAEGVAKRALEMTPELQKKAWLEADAYKSDAFRLVVNPKLCLQCHGVGYMGPKEGTGQTVGPSLENVHDRLRPGWTKYWVANPQRFLTYVTAMPNNFINDVKVMTPEDPWLDIFPGTQLDRVMAVRDLLMVFPSAEKMPLNRLIAHPPLEAKEEKKADEKKTDEKKEKEKKEEKK